MSFNDKQLVQISILLFVVLLIFTFGFIATRYDFIFGFFLIFSALAGGIFLLYFGRHLGIQEIGSKCPFLIRYRFPIYYSLQVVRISLALLPFWFGHTISAPFDTFLIIIFAVYIIDLWDSIFIFNSVQAKLYKRIDWLFDFISFGLLFIFAGMVWPDFRGFSIFWLLSQPLIVFLADFYHGNYILFKPSSIVLPAYVFSLLFSPFFLFAELMALAVITLNPFLEYFAHLRNTERWVDLANMNENMTALFGALWLSFFIGLLLFFA